MFELVKFLVVGIMLFKRLCETLTFRKDVHFDAKTVANQKFESVTNIESKCCQNGSRNDTSIIKGNPCGQSLKKEPVRERPLARNGKPFLINYR